MLVTEKRGSFLPAKLAAELCEAGVACLGVTCTEENEHVVAVQILCEDGADEATIELVCAAHEPVPAPAAEPELPPLEAALAAMAPDKTLTASELLAIIRGD